MRKLEELTLEIEREFRVARDVSSRVALIYIQRSYEQGWQVGERDLREVFGGNVPRVTFDVNRSNFLARYSFEAIKGIEQLGRERVRDVFLRAERDATLRTEDVVKILRTEFFDQVEESRLHTIARTETNRVGNAAKLDRYRASGVSHKEAVTASDGRVRDFETSGADHRAIHGQVRPLTEPFTIPRIRGGQNDNGDQYPPFDPNCRCTVIPHRAQGFSRLSPESRLRAWRRTLSPFERAMLAALQAPWREARHRVTFILRTRGPAAFDEARALTA